MREQDLRRALEALELSLGRLRRGERRADADFDALMLGLAAARGREAQRLRLWLNGQLPELAGEPDAAAPATAAENPPAQSGDSGYRGSAGKGDNRTAQLLERRQITDDLLILRLGARPVSTIAPTTSSSRSPASAAPTRWCRRRTSRSWSSSSSCIPARQALELRGIAPGTPIGLGAAKAGPRLASTRRRHLMVATVAGIAPFVSLLRERLRAPAGEDEFHILHGASYRDEFGYDRELAALAAHPAARLRYRPAVSRPEEPRNAGWSGERGRVADRVEGYMGAQAMSAADTALYAWRAPRAGGERAPTLRPARLFVMQLEPY